MHRRITLVAVAGLLALAVPASAQDTTAPAPTSTYDTPTLAPYHPDWTTALEEALTLRPELWVQRVSAEDVVRERLDTVPTPAAEDLAART